MKRSELETYKLYYVEDREMYVATPDGVGVVWYSDREDAEEETGLTFIQTSVIRTLKDWP